MTYNKNYNITYPTQSDYYNVDVTNGNFSKIADALDLINDSKVDSDYVDMGISKLMVKRMSVNSKTITAVSLSAGDNIIIAKKGFYSNGSALIIIDVSGNSKHHSLVLAVSTSFNSNEKTITCLSNSSYGTTLFSSASVETKWQKDNIIYLTLATGIATNVNDNIDINITIISNSWDCYCKVLKASEILTTDTKKILLTPGKANLDLGTAALKNFETSVNKDSNNLVTSCAVYNEIFNKRLIYTIALSTSTVYYKNKADYIIDATRDVSEQIIDRLKYIDRQITDDRNLRGITILFMPGTYQINTDLVLSDYSNFKLEGLAGNTTFNVKSGKKIAINSDETKYYNIEFKNISFTKDECVSDMIDCICYCKNTNDIKFKDCNFALICNKDNIKGQSIFYCDSLTANLTIIGGSMSCNLDNCTNYYYINLVGTKNSILSVMLGEIRSNKNISINFPKHDGRGTTSYCKWGLWAIDEYTDGVLNN